MKRSSLCFLATLIALTVATPANALPVAAIAALFPALTTLAATIITVAINVALTVGFSALINLIAPKPQRQASIVTMAIGEQPRTAIFGICAVQGVLE